MKSAVKYYAAIAATVIDIGLIALFIILEILTCSGVLIKPIAFQAVDTTKIMFFKIVWIIPIVICTILFILITNIRRKLRDEYEYDKNGVSKEYGHFEKLSADERKEIEKQKMIDAERILDSQTLKNITHKGSKCPQADMDAMIGLDSVKAQMTEIAARMTYEKKEWKRNGNKGKFKPKEAMHMIFMGEPGTGKTTVARIMAGFLYKNGYIRKNQSIEVDGNFLKGLTPGESSKKTKMLIKKSMGGVLFIDEAYSLLAGSDGQETIATIVKEMEDHRDDLVIILAGYDKEMKQLINSNPGIESRIKYYLWFGDYTMSDYQKMFMQLAHKRNLQVSSECLSAVVKRLKYEKTLPNFGNARAVRNLFEKTLDKHAVRVVNEHATVDKLTADDVPDIEKRHN